jgi:hypothetical protein
MIQSYSRHDAGKITAVMRHYIDVKIFYIHFHQAKCFVPVLLNSFQAWPLASIAFLT